MSDQSRVQRRVGVKIIEEKEEGRESGHFVSNDLKQEIKNTDNRSLGGNVFSSFDSLFVTTCINDRRPRSQFL